MILRAIAFAAAGVVATQVQAQTIVTRSGEHGEFTRLVMRIPESVDWSVTQNGRMAIVNVGSTSAVFDTESVFSLIQRDRIESLSQAGPGQPLRIDLACDCEVAHYQQRDGFLVIDVSDADGLREANQLQFSENPLPLFVPSAPNGLSFNLGAENLATAQLATGLSRAVEQTFGTGVVEPFDLPLSDALGPRRQEELPTDEENQTETARSTSEQTSPPISGDPAVMIDLEEGQRTAMVNDTEQRLLQQIGRANQQGLIELDERAEESNFLDPLGNENRPLDGLPNISVTSAVDRETGLLAAHDDGAKEETHCLRNSYVAIHKWETPGKFDEKIGALRNRLLGEFDEIDNDAVLSLARTYLYFGFGAETISTLRMLPESALRPQRREVIETMARIMDGGELPVNTVFSGQQTCNGDVAFWAALAAGSVKKTANTDAIQQAFAKLPTHLRVHLGPRMATLFADAGDPHVAKVALRSVDRTGVEDVPDRNIAEAAIAELEGKPDKVVDHLTDEVADRTQNAPFALIELIDLSVKERKALSPDVPDLAASYELESRETELGRELRRAEVSALSLTGRYAEAFGRFKSLTERDGPTARREAAVPFFTLLTERADDVTFLKYAMSFAYEATVDEANDTGDIVARRLINLGFVDEASALLRKVDIDAGNEQRRLMQAEIALITENPQRALVELMGLDSDEANRMRADALWRNQEYERATEYMLKSDDVDSAARALWHSQDLERAEEVGGDRAPFANVAEITSEIDLAVQPPEGLQPLAEARALIESSASARTDIEELLRQVGRQPQDDG